MRPKADRAPAIRIPLPAWTREPPVPAVVAALAKGGAVRFVGGCVRDTVRGVEAVGEIDLATTVAPESVAALAEAAGFKTVATGIDHGTVTVIADDRQFEVTTLRRDVTTDGRHAEVAFTDDWLADASRRDFTFNAMTLAPDGALYDPFDGRRDLAAGRVRFVGAARRRVVEDRLRLLRFFRFYAWFGRPPPDPDAIAACRSLAASVDLLPGERVRVEMLKLLAAADPLPALDLMAESGVLERVVPVLRTDWRRRLGRLVALERGAVDGERRLAAIVAGETRALARRLRFSRAQAARLSDLAAPAHSAFGLDATAARRLLYRIGRDRYRDLAFLAWADAGTSEGLDSALAAADEWRRPALPVRGRDVVALGVPPGDRVGELLSAIEEWWAAGDYRASRTAALDRLRTLVAESRGLKARQRPGAST